MFWANYRRAPALAVPAPFDDKSSPFWWYDRIAEMAHGLAAIGFTDVLFPNPIKGESGANRTGDGYNPFDDYDIGSKQAFGAQATRFGTADRLRRAVAVCRANGLGVHIDHVMHQRMGGKAGVYRYPGSDGTSLDGRFPKDPGCFRGPPPRVAGDPVPSPADDFPFGDELCPVNATPLHWVRDGLLAASDWLFRTLGIQGARLDDMKGMATSFINEFVDHGAMRGKFFFGEYASGNRDDTEWWVNQVERKLSAFDFDFHYNMVQPMCNQAGAGTFFMGDLAGRGMIGIDPLHAVPFVESMDSDTNGFATIVDNKALGYALLLAGEGLPLVYARDYLAEPGCYGLRAPIDNLVWIHQNLANGPTVARYGDAKVFVFERTSPPGLLVTLNNDVWNPAWRTVTVQTAFGPNVVLHDYTGKNAQDCRTDAHGVVTLGIPPGAHGQGYGCWSVPGVETPIHVQPQACAQVFFGAADLDIPPATQVASQVARIWCARGTRLHASLSLHAPDAGAAEVTVSSPAGIESTLSCQPGAPGHAVIETGWHAVRIRLLQSNGESAFDIELRYQAPATLARTEF